MKHFIGIFFCLAVSGYMAAAEPLVFGAISPVDPALMEKKLTPLMAYLAKETGREILFQTGRDYEDTIAKFADGTFDLGYIGPSPYIKATEQEKGCLRILAGLQNRGGSHFHSVIVTREKSVIRNLDDLKGKRFAFGSPDSTLSYYVPNHMLNSAGVKKRLKRYDFLGRHDKVAKYVIMGKYDAGAMKESVAMKYGKYLRVIAKSRPIPDFMVVSHRSCESELAEKIRRALLRLKDPDVVKAIKPSAVGFVERSSDEYGELRMIMQAEEH